MKFDLLYEINELLGTNHKGLDDIPRSDLLKALTALLIAVEMEGLRP